MLALTDLAGGSPAENAQITMDILTCQERGPRRDVTVLNAAMALYLGIDNCTAAGFALIIKVKYRLIRLSCPWNRDHEYRQKIK
jgi:anthranilate phosphoribosyltransferase